MDIKPISQQPMNELPSSQFPSPEPSNKPGLWDMVRDSKYFPVISIVIVAVIVIGLGFAVAGLLGRFGQGKQVVKGPENVEYSVGGDAILKLTVARAAYFDEYNGAKPMAEGRKFVVVELTIQNASETTAGAYTRDDLRLITPGGDNMKPIGGSAGFFDYGIAAKSEKKGEVLFDIDQKSAQLPLNQYQIAFGKNYGSRANYPLTEM